ncbi:Uma2 family endonuclease [Larkinella sp. VNQ87]|uniref:Uma2 family endonuclease n=1 Tax=Larkinella sp. VNQ87 TaxID=3400921 RepID=UPI003C0BF03A
MTTITDFSQLDLSKRYTYADYLTWEFDESVELIKGWVYRMSPAPKRIHQRVSGRLFSDIEQRLRGKTCEVYHAPFDVRLTTTSLLANRRGEPEQIETVVQPDICVICDPDKLDDRGCLGAPDWIIEILSPGTVVRDLRDKFDLYEENGVGEYWTVAPGEKAIHVFLHDGIKYQPAGTYVEPGPVPVRTIENFSVEWRDVFD